MNEIETHPFGAYVPASATVLIVGSFPGREQTQGNLHADEWFYGAKRNQFWKILSGVYQMQVNTKKDKEDLLLKKGIAITDIFLQVKRKNGSNLDENLVVVAYNDEAIRSILQSVDFKTIYFTSRFVEKHFNRMFPEVKNTEYLPSPSPRYARLSLLDKINYYKAKLPC